MTDLVKAKACYTPSKLYHFRHFSANPQLQHLETGTAKPPAFSPFFQQTPSSSPENSQSNVVKLRLTERLEVFDVANTSGGFQVKVASFTPKPAADSASPCRGPRQDPLPVVVSEVDQEPTFDFLNEDTVENIYTGYASDEDDHDGSDTEDGTPQTISTPPEDSFYSLHLPYYIEGAEELYLDHPRPDSPTLGYLNYPVDLDTRDDFQTPVPASANTAKTAVPPNAPEPSAQISLDDLVIIQAIGQGTTGGVFHVLHRKKQTRHALKAVMDVYREDGKERKSGMTRWLVEELSALKSVQTIKGFVGLEASWSDTKNFYFLSPLYATDLECEIRDCGRLPRDRYTFYFAQLVIALQDLHSLGIIHRDIKPANLMLDFSGNLIIGDFGLSHEFSMRPSLEERTTQPYYSYWRTDHVGLSGKEDMQKRPVDTLPYVMKGNCGSPAHMAPEMWLQEPYSFPVDWWSAGTVLYVMATGRLPFMVPHLESEAAFGSRVVHEELEFEPGEVDVETKHIIQQMLRKKPEDRLPIQKIEQHPFFLGMIWPILRTREITPPYIPPQDPTHTLNGCSRPLTVGRPYEKGTNPCPEFDYISPNFFQDTQVVQTPVVEETQGGPPRKRSTFSSVWSRLLAARKEAAFTDTRQDTRDPHPFAVLRDHDEQLAAGEVPATFLSAYGKSGNGIREKVLRIDIPVTKSVGHQTADSPRMQYFKDRMRRIF